MTTAPEIKAIETSYAGCRFRSRLEARWAVFFDTLGIDWQYEPQGHVVNGQPYLPDFRLPDAWVEVKGSECELDKRLLRSFATKHSVLALGPIPKPDVFGEWCWTMLVPSPTEKPPGWPTAPDWSAVEFEAFEEPVSFGHWRSSGHLLGHYPDISGPWEPGQWTVPYLDRDCANSSASAYRAARSARFEHGECG